MNQIIEVVNERPTNGDHFVRLLEFCREILAICDELKIAPVLSGSLAVFGYTKNHSLAVNDVDLACSKLDFPKLSLALQTRGIEQELKPWHVLQSRRADLKVEFDSLEYWMAGIPDDYNSLSIAGITFKVVSLSSLRELYRRGLEDTRNKRDDINRAKHAALTHKHDALATISDRNAL